MYFDLSSSQFADLPSLPQPPRHPPLYLYLMRLEPWENMSNLCFLTEMWLYHSEVYMMCVLMRSWREGHCCGVRFSLFRRQPSLLSFTLVNDERSSPRICPRCCRHRACSSGRSRRPSSPRPRRGASRSARTPGGPRSRPADTRQTGALTLDFGFPPFLKITTVVSRAQTWQESTPPFMLPAQNMLWSRVSPYTWGALHFSWEIRRTRASSSWLVPCFSETQRMWRHKTDAFMVFKKHAGQDVFPYVFLCVRCVNLS